MNNRLIKLGFCTYLPIENNIEMPNYSIENKNLIKLWSNKFQCIQIMFSKNKLSSKEIKDIKLLIKNYKYIFVHA